ncbi:hypothetical protein MRX96_050008 [Rhipicephalus microplus]
MILREGVAVNVICIRHDVSPWEQKHVLWRFVTRCHGPPPYSSGHALMRMRFGAISSPITQRIMRDWPDDLIAVDNSLSQFRSRSAAHSSDRRIWNSTVTNAAR